VNDSVFMTVNSKKIKMVKTWVPAYARYFRFAGLAKYNDKDLTVMQVYGDQKEGYDQLVLWR